MAICAKKTINNIDIYNIDDSIENEYTAVVLEFDFGYKEYVSNAEKTMSYNIRGIIGILEGDGPFLSYS